MIVETYKGMCEKSVIFPEFWLAEFLSVWLAKMPGNDAEKCSYFLERLFRGQKKIMFIIYFKMLQDQKNLKIRTVTLHESFL